MEITPYFEAAIYRRTVADDAQFSAWTEGLPVREESTPFHCGPHSVRSLRTAYEFCGRPENVLEVGFCIGYSASMWFGLGAVNVTSIENSSRPQTMQAAKFMKDWHGSHFHFLQGSSERLLDWKPSLNFGLMFIDGGHELPQISADISLGKALGIPYLLFDDYFPNWGPGTQPAIEHHGLIPLAIIGNQALCVTGDLYK